VRSKAYLKLSLI